MLLWAPQPESEYACDFGDSVRTSNYAFTPQMASMHAGLLSMVHCRRLFCSLLLVSSAVGEGDASLGQIPQMLARLALYKEGNAKSVAQSALSIFAAVAQEHLREVSTNTVMMMLGERCTS
jgi:hypothetical protein